MAFRETKAAFCLRLRSGIGSGCSACPVSTSRLRLEVCGHGREARCLSTKDGILGATGSLLAYDGPVNAHIKPLLSDAAEHGGLSRRVLLHVMKKTAAMAEKRVFLRTVWDTRASGSPLAYDGLLGPMVAIHDA